MSIGLKCAVGQSITIDSAHVFDVLLGAWRHSLRLDCLVSMNQPAAETAQGQRLSNLLRGVRDKEPGFQTTFTLAAGMCFDELMDRALWFDSLP